MPVELSRDIVLRCEDADTGLVPLLREGGIDVVLAREPAAPFREACERAGVRVAADSELNLCDLPAFRKATGPAALVEGLWPGVSRASHSFHWDDIAMASGPPWVDANGFRYAWLRVLCPDRLPVLAFLPNEAAGLPPGRIVPYTTLEVALVEAWVSGGNYVLALEERYRSALLRGDTRALAAWRQLGRTAAWLKEHKALFGRPTLPQITALVDDGEASAEIANLLFRHSASPSLEPAAAPPAPDPSQRLAIVAASINAPGPAVRDRILAHAAAGAIVVTDRGEGAPWWRVPQLRLERDEADREVYRFGRGTVVAYKETISDPSDFALDVIDLVTHPRRAVRIWGAYAAIATVTRGPATGPLRASAVLHTINYGSPLRSDVLVYVQGNYSSAVLVRPEADRMPLKTAPRGTATEITLPQLDRVAAVLLT